MTGCAHDIQIMGDRISSMQTYNARLVSILSLFSIFYRRYFVFYYSAADKAAEYCDDRVSLYVSVCVCLSV